MSLHILTFYLTMTQNHRKHPRFRERREQKGREIFTMIAAWMKLWYVRKELHMMLNDIFKINSYYFSWVLFRKWLAGEGEGDLGKPLLFFFFLISKTCQIYGKYLQGNSLSECTGTVESHPEPLIDHLGKGPGQPWEHKWRQFTCVTGRSGAWLHLS